ncbi:hypothetical protein N1030_01455 [Desulfovibrio mangrovi]|uniref:hypothetical protein n=1 Tax=Desulfovibrio mangrovi TaxID=2976983 RepID=UPI00224565FD|nr:hypothetical protein [Desulfovibrio mangrovi]UZP67660.1 hypothetical protein N1030_01455 [Desulfovibrio mangrovi]
MSLRDQMQADLAMMTSTDEFGEEITLCGASIIAIVDVSKESGSYDDRQAVFVETATLRFAEGAVALPPVGRQVEFNGEDWIMGPTDEEDGLLVLRLWRDLA